MVNRQKVHFSKVNRQKVHRRVGSTNGKLSIYVFLIFTREGCVVRSMSLCQFLLQLGFGMMMAVLFVGEVVIVLMLMRHGMSVG